MELTTIVPINKRKERKTSIIPMQINKPSTGNATVTFGREIMRQLYVRKEMSQGSIDILMEHLSSNTIKQYPALKNGLLIAKINKSVTSALQWQKSWIF